MYLYIYIYIYNMYLYIYIYIYIYISDVSSLRLPAQPDNVQQHDYQ